jgi:hypothetical protein
VDLAVSLKDSADLTVLFTIAVHPDQTREVLNIESGRFTGPEIVQRIANVHRRYTGEVIVEGVAAQRYICQFAKALGNIPVRAYMTGKGERSLDWQTERLATEMANGQWIIPSDDGRPNHPEVAASCETSPTTARPDIRRIGSRRPASRGGARTRARCGWRADTCRSYGAGDARRARSPARIASPLSRVRRLRMRSEVRLHRYDAPSKWTRWFGAERAVSSANIRRHAADPSGTIQPDRCPLASKVSRRDLGRFRSYWPARLSSAAPPPGRSCPITRLVLTG